MKKPRHNPQHPTIELVKDSYQPTKAELEADMRVEADFEELARALVQPVNIRWIDRPRNRR